jgi:hypothetical protein
MFMVTESDAAAIRAAFEQDGELSAAIELRRRFPGITDNAKARERGVTTRFVQNCTLSCPFSRLLDATTRSPVLPMLGIL